MAIKVSSPVCYFVQMLRQFLSQRPTWNSVGPSLGLSAAGPSSMLDPSLGLHVAGLSSTLSGTGPALTQGTVGLNSSMPSVGGLTATQSFSESSQGSIIDIPSAPTSTPTSFSGSNLHQQNQTLLPSARQWTIVNHSAIVLITRSGCL